MSIEVIHPRDEKHWLELRKQDVTSTETAALFGISPYMTHFELYHRKHDNLDVEFEPNERVKWGTRLQDSIANGIAEDQNWHIRRMDEYIHDTDLRMGASFDFEFSIDSLGKGILEIKNVDSLAFRDGWIVDGDNVEAPPHIEIQVQQQLALSGFKVAYIGALIGGNRVVLIRREPDISVIGAIKKRIKEFWESVESNNPPRPDFARDSDFIASLYSYAEPNKVFNATERVSVLAQQYRSAAQDAKAAEEKKDAIKAEILTLIGEASKVVGEWGLISCGLIGPCHMEYERKGYRQFKPTFKKEKP
jgi:putative phage-type endonuclease